jgi:hypothetical protein
MSAQSRVSLWGVVICVSSGSQDNIGRYPTLEALLSESDALELFQAILLGGTVHHSITEDGISHLRVKDSRLARPAATGFVDILGILEGPRMATLTVEQAGVIVAFVQEFENA